MFKRSIAWRLVLVVGAAITCILATSGGMLTQSIGARVGALKQANMQHLVHSALIMVKAYNRELEDRAKNLSALFGETFAGPFELDATQEMLVEGQRLPLLTQGGKPLAGDHHAVDRFAALTGGNATIFVKRGEDFVRVVTSVKKQDGSRAVGTLLDRASPAYARVIRGEAFTGKVNLFGRQFVTNYTPIKDSAGQIIGIRYIGIGFDESLQSLKDGLGALAIGQNGYIFALDAAAGDRRGAFVLHPALAGRNLDQESGGQFVAHLLQQGGGELVHQGPQQGRSGPVSGEWVTYFETIPELNWIVAATVPAEELSEVNRWLVRLMLAMTVLIIACAALVLVLAVRRLVGAPLAQAVVELEHIAAGDYSRAIKVTRDDEAGQLQRALQRMQQQVREVLVELTRTAGELAGAAGQTSAASARVAQGSAEQSHAAAQIASTIEELTVSVDRLAENAEEAKSLSESSYRTSEEGAQVIAQAGMEMQGISSSVSGAASDLDQLGEMSGQISTVLAVIEDIAKQTNLLALNAAIEAARAGEQGRGFAVVADEVRSLAGRTTTSAREISVTIADIQQSTQRAVGSMQAGVQRVEQGAALSTHAGESIQSIRDGSQRVMEVFSGISLMLKEQAQASNDVAENVERIAAMTETNTQSVRQVAEAARELEIMADSLKRLVASFRI
ncbi:methyl-accepting chemotaxis protein [Pseudomonas cavernae]|uniref:Methyl-accepting chemotaxis protein n=2 Tax=Pseudomonas cavernae TaxID=2320867 RepID=A0A385Z1M0_9PSED|nr:methyl-accepting chemotaxis protein [Pseudomonas cavernae]AYC32976.1 methyl-accepting chemotaxis protein [Pseudomonas cavernae]